MPATSRSGTVSRRRSTRAAPPPPPPSDRAALEDLTYRLIEAEALATAAAKASTIPRAPSVEHDRAVRRLVVYVDLLRAILDKAVEEAERAVGWTT